VIQKPEHRSVVLEAADDLAAEIRNQRYAGEPVTVEVDKRDLGGGVKNWDWIKRGVPIRLELGPRDLEKGTVAIARRDRPIKEKAFRPVEEVIKAIPDILSEIQAGLYQRAKELRDQNTVKIDSKADFYDFFTPKDADRPEIHGGFAFAHWSGDSSVEAQIKEDLKVTIRCIPTDPSFKDETPGKCIFTGAPSSRRVLFGKAY
jgi:prolyl-tRNA synthetase